jgi:hypothetical protein
LLRGLPVIRFSSICGNKETEAVSEAMTALADMHLVVMLADTASVSLLPQIEENRMTGPGRDN